jgi:hypothetical protein
MPPPYGDKVLDISITHLRDISAIAAAAQSAGATAAKRDRHQHQEYTFVLWSVETYGSLDKPLVRYLNDINAFAASKSSSVSKGSFLSSAYRDLRVAGLDPPRGRVVDFPAYVIDVQHPRAEAEAHCGYGAVYD